MLESVLFLQNVIFFGILLSCLFLLYNTNKKFWGTHQYGGLNNITGCISSVMIGYVIGKNSNPNSSNNVLRRQIFDIFVVGFHLKSDNEEWTWKLFHNFVLQASSLKSAQIRLRNPGLRCKDHVNLHWMHRTNARNARN